MGETIRTERLTLKPVVAEDAEVATPHCNDPRIHRMVTSIPAHQTVDEVASFFSKMANDPDADLFSVWHNRSFAGVCSTALKPDKGLFSLGYWYAPHYWGSGFATEAGTALIAYTLHNRRISGLISSYFVDNPASGRVLNKLGFMPAGRITQFCMGRGEHVPTREVGFISAAAMAPIA